MFDTSVSSSPFHVYSLPIPALFPNPRLNMAAHLVLSKIASRGRDKVAISAQWGRDTLSKVMIDSTRKWVWDIVRDGLVQNNVVHEDSHYIPGLRAKTYSLTPEYMYVPTRVITSPHITWKPRDTTSHRSANGVGSVPSWAMESLTSAALDVPRLVHDLVVSRGVPTELAGQLGRTGSRFVTADFNAICDAIHEYAGAMADWQDSRDLTPVWQCWVDGDTWAHRDPSGNRLHTPITNMARKHRKYLYSVNEPVDTRYVEIDAVNSQVIFVASLALRDLRSRDATSFADTAYAGQFYEVTFRAVHNRDMLLHERDAWKTSVMATWLYATPQVQANSKEGRAIGALWPNVHTWLLERKKRDGVAAVPCDMQRLEASIWVDNLIPRLGEARITVWTVHDCVIVPERAASTARELITSAYTAANIVAPVLRTTQLSEIG